MIYSITSNWHKKIWLYTNNKDGHLRDLKTVGKNFKNLYKDRTQLKKRLHQFI